MGGIAKPWQIVRVAEAEAKAAAIQTQSRIDISEIERRAIIRMIQEEGKKQENIENITYKSIEKISVDANTQAVENDWITYFFDRCRLTSDEDMQIVWSNILAGEANSPGSFSRRTIDAVSNMDKYDAGLFTSLCRLVWMTPGSNPLVFDAHHKIYNDVNLNFGTLSHLENIGLIKYSAGLFGLGYQNKYDSNTVEIIYCGEVFLVTLPETEGDFHLKVGQVIFTKVGQELFRVCGSVFYEEFLNYVTDILSQQGYTIQRKNGGSV